VHKNVIRFPERVCVEGSVARFVSTVVAGRMRAMSKGCHFPPKIVLTSIRRSAAPSAMMAAPPRPWMKRDHEEPERRSQRAQRRPENKEPNWLCTRTRSPSFPERATWQQRHDERPPHGAAELPAGRVERLANYAIVVAITPSLGDVSMSGSSGDTAWSAATVRTRGWSARLSRVRSHSSW
jgi:hypothetical protein